MLQDYQHQQKEIMKKIKNNLSVISSDGFIKEAHNEAER